MTQDEILDIWGRAGGGVIDDMPYTLVECFAKLVEDAAFKRWAAQTKLAVENEREACAKVCEERIMGSPFAAAIRARGQE